MSEHDFEDYRMDRIEKNGSGGIDKGEVVRLASYPLPSSVAGSPQNLILSK